MATNSPVTGSTAARPIRTPSIPVVGASSLTAFTAEAWAFLSNVLTIRRPPPSISASVNPRASSSSCTERIRYPVGPLYFSLTLRFLISGKLSSASSRSSSVM